MGKGRRNKGQDRTTSEIHVGPVLKRLRTRAGLSLRTLAARAGFSASFLSLLEKAQVSPSISSLERIARALNVTVVELLQRAPVPADGVFRGESRAAFTSSWSRARIESLSPGGDNGAMQALAVTLAPTGTSGAHPAEQPHHQFVYQLRGTLTLFIGDRRIELKTGDAVTIPPGTPHRWQNESRRPAQVLMVLSPPR